MTQSVTGIAVDFWASALQHWRWAANGGTIDMRGLKPCIGALLLACMSGPALGWSEESHMTTGAMAYNDLLGNSPELMPEIERILAAHPDRKALDAHLVGLEAGERKRALFEWLARWPDDANGTPFEHRDWHYELRVINTAAWIWPFRNGNASGAFDHNFGILSDKKAPLSERAVAFSWLLHIIGDIQQPLHAGHWMSWRFRTTDHAGTYAFVRRTKNGAATDLHQYWDKILDRSGAADATADYWVPQLEQEFPRSALPELAETTAPRKRYRGWIDDSFKLARIAAYQGAFLKATDTQKNAPVVSRDYTIRSQYIAKRRVALGGYRIADMIRLALAKAS